jgi:hypothetical protein
MLSKLPASESTHFFARYPNFTRIWMKQTQDMFDRDGFTGTRRPQNVSEFSGWKIDRHTFQDVVASIAEGFVNILE